MTRLALAAVLTLAGLAHAQPVAVFVPEAINLPAGDVAAFAAVCSQQYARVTSRDAVTAGKAAVTLHEKGSCEAAAQELGLSEYVSYSLVRLPGESGDARILVTATRRDPNGVSLHSVQLEMASLADAPALCNRVHGALQKKVAIEVNRDRSNVTTAEANASEGGPRLGTEKVVGFKFAFAMPVGSGGLYNPMATLAFDLRLEREMYFLELGVGALIPAVVTPGAGTYGGITSELGASFYLTHGDIAPYLGGGILPRIIIGNGSVVNFAPYAQAGLMFWRESSTRIYLDLRVAQNVLPTIRVAGNAPAYPTELGLQVGMGF